MKESDASTCCSAPTDVSVGEPLPRMWTEWIVQRALERGVQVIGAFLGPDGWVEVDAGSVLGLVSRQALASITQRVGCRGTSTKLVLGDDDGPVAALLVERVAGFEDPRWRSLLLEALVLDRRSSAARPVPAEQ